MYLSRLYIQNYRSIRELDLQFAKGKNVIVGRNNAGKSNIVRALDLIFGEYSPTWARSEKVIDNDFYSWKEVDNDQTVVRSADSLFIWCELTRELDEQLNFDEIDKCASYPVYSRATQPRSYAVKEPVRISKELLPQHPEDIFDITDEDGDIVTEWVGPKVRSLKTFRRELENKYRFAFAFYAKKDKSGKINKDIRFLYRESPDQNWILAFRAPIRCELLQSAIIPSFRDPQNQLRLTNWTWYGKLMKHLTANHAQSPELQEAFDKVRVIADSIFASVKTTVVQSSLDVAFPGTDLFFQFNADTQTDLYKSCVIYVDDGFRSQLTDKGSGVQSATIIGLFNYYTQHVNTVTSALLCIEEPELYLHPHARRVISDRLDDFLNNGKNQVILTTHSTEFLRTTSADLNVVLVGKPEGTKARPVQIREFKHLLLDNNQNELFFADKVIVCEGFDNYILSAIAKHHFGKLLDEQNVSIVSVGGKDRISQLVKLIVKLGLQCFVFADFDYLLRDQTGKCKDYDKDAKNHENILHCGLDFFSQPCLFGPNGKEAEKRISQIRNDLKASDESKFYLAKSAAEFGDPQLLTTLSNMRQKGIGILDGEIEHLSKDQSFLSPGSKKLKLEKVFDLNARLTDGERLDDILDTTQVLEFLNAVFAMKAYQAAA